MSGDMFGCLKWGGVEGATGIQRVEAKKAAKDSAMPRMPPQQRTIWLQCQQCEKPWHTITFLDEFQNLLIF